MDRKNLIFIIALSLALFGVNYYFQQQTIEERKEWQAKQESLKAKKEADLRQDIQRRTAPQNSLPIANFYGDAGKSDFLGAGVIIGKNLLTLSWNKDLPSHVYAASVDGQEETMAFELAYHTDELGSPALYMQEKQNPLLISSLPDFGIFDLQIITINFHDIKHPYGITLGQYADGHFSLPQSALAPTPENESLWDQIIGDNLHKYTGITLIKTTDGYLPVGFYDPARKALVEIDEIPALVLLSKKPEEKALLTTKQKPQEKFYVLENKYQQLVFSNYGGSLVEINLPFESKEDKSSVVREIGFDRQMIEHHPYNARFPAHPYYTPGQKMEEHSQGVLGGYYPLIRRDLIQSANRKTVRIPPQFYAFNIVSEYPEMAELVYEVKEFNEHSIVFEAVQNLRRITKTFSFDIDNPDAPYTFKLSVKIDGDSRGLWLTSGVPEVEWISGAPAPSLKYRITRNNKPDVENIELPSDAMTVTSIYPDWVCNSNGFLGLIVDPLTEIDPGYRAQYVSGVTVPSRLVEIDQEYDRYKAQNMPGYMTLLPLSAKGGTMQFRIFAGPFADTILKTIDQTYSNPDIGYNPDYIACQTFHGWFSFISEPFAKFLLILMNFFHFMTGSWALSIVLLTVSLRIMLYPLNAWSTKSMVKMQQIAPEVTAIQEKYKKDPKKAQLEIMNLYRERGVNPASGCLPLLIQMPFLIGMFDLLKSSFALRGASFIPGWIDDLTAPDVLFHWNYPIFFIGTEFHLLPILLGIVMFAQQRFFSTGPKDPSQMTDQQRQQKAMGNIMAVVFTIMFYNFPSGLNIYWLSSMLLGMLQQWTTTKQLQKQAANSAVLAKQPVKK